MTREINGIIDNICDTPGVSGQKHGSKKIISISELKNSFKYNLRNVLIIRYWEFYRLIVINENVLLMDESYKTANGAKIGFLRKFSHRLFKQLKNRTLPEWSKFSPIDTNIDIKSIYKRMSQA